MDCKIDAALTLRERVRGRSIGTRNRDRPGHRRLQRDEDLIAVVAAGGGRAVRIGRVDLAGDVVRHARAVQRIFQAGICGRPDCDRVVIRGVALPPHGLIGGRVRRRNRRADEGLVLIPQRDLVAGLRAVQVENVGSRSAGAASCVAGDRDPRRADPLHVVVPNAVEE
jgi:hypothetical protein